MNMDSASGIAEFKVKFGGDLNEINVNTLLESLASITTVLDEVSNEIGDGQRFEIKIKAIDRGSFLIHLGLTPIEIVDLLKNVDWKTAAAVVSLAVGLFKLRQLLKGKQPQKVEDRDDNVEITTESGNMVQVAKNTFNIYNSNVNVGEALSKNFRALNSNESVRSFEIEDETGRTVFQAQADEFETLSVTALYESSDEQERQLLQPATLNIVKIVWDKSRKWEFYYQGSKITAAIADSSFFEQIDKGEQFAKGDCLKVELIINQIFDDSVNTFVNKSYVVSKVFRHLPRPPQIHLPL